MMGTFRFADFELDGRSGELRKRGRRLRVQQQPLQILAMLVAAPGDVITREELRERIWGKSTHVEGHTILAEIQKLYEWDWEAAERSYRRAIQLDPAYSVAHHWYAQLLSILARHDEAHAEMEAARRSDPLSPTIAAFFSYVAFEAGRYEAAVTAAHDALELEANAPLTQYMLGRAYAKLGDMA